MLCWNTPNQSREHLVVVTPKIYKRLPAKLAIVGGSNPSVLVVLWKNQGVGCLGTHEPLVVIASGIDEMPNDFGNGPAILRWFHARLICGHCQKSITPQVDLQHNPVGYFVRVSHRSQVLGKACVVRDAEKQYLP